MIRLQVQSNIESIMEEWGRKRKQLAENRKAGTQEAMRYVLGEVIARHPVETGRSRKAWEAAGSRLGDADGRSKTASEGEGSATVLQDEYSTQVVAKNSVEYEPFLEYGTSKMKASAMVRSGLAAGAMGAARRLWNALLRGLVSG